MFKDIVKKNRSYRKFHEDFEVKMGTLEDLVDLARHSASGMNLQTLKYILVTEKEKRDLVYPNIKWAAYLKDWGGPKPGERPSSFILVFKDKGIKNSAVEPIDLGIACQTILLGAAEKGLGGCMIGSFDEELICEAFKIKEQYELQLVIAVGKPNQNIIIDEIKEDGDIKYWVDKEGNHHVPKRKLEDIIIIRD
jgi:nitroreductase